MKSFPPRTKPVSTVDSMDAAQMRRLIERADDLVVARLMVQYFEKTDLHRRLPGAYLAAAETVKRAQTIYAKYRATGKTVRAIGIGLARLGVKLAKACVAVVKLGFRDGKQEQPDFRPSNWVYPTLTGWPDAQQQTR